MLLVSALLVGCTDAGLYNRSEPPIEADRVALTGRVCADDPETARFPVRVVIVADQAGGPLFADFDPGAARVDVLSRFVQSALARPEYAFAVVGYAGRATRLAPLEPDPARPGAFTRNPGELLNALTRLSLPVPCLGEDTCRDYEDGLRAARAVIEDDLAARPAGLRATTHYVVLFVNAGPQIPLARARDCCAEGAECEGADNPSHICQRQLDAARVAAMRDLVAAEGAAGFQFHVMHLAASGDAEIDDIMAVNHQQLAFAGGGRYARFGAAGAIAVDPLRLFDQRSALRVKRLIVANLNALPGPDGLRPDSDADGLADAEEAAFGADPDLPDTDGDGITDLVEVLAGQSPAMADTPTVCADLEVPAADLDLDGLTDCDEALLGTDRSLVDSDGDGLPDPLEVAFGTDYLVADQTADADADGIPNGDEVRDHTDPRSADLPARLGEAYRYQVDDLGTVREPVAPALRSLPGVEIVEISGGSTPGQGRVRWVPGRGLTWQDPGDDAPGPLVPLADDAPHRLELPSSSFAPIQGDDGRRVVVEVNPEALPPSETGEAVRVAFRERHCVGYTVRNVRMLTLRPGADTRRGALNNLFLYLSQAPDSRPEKPGPVKLAHVPVRYDAPDYREPTGARLVVRDEEFVRPRLDRFEAGF